MWLQRFVSTIRQRVMYVLLLSPPGGHRDLLSQHHGFPLTAITVTHCDGRDNTDVRYPPFGAAGQSGGRYP